MYKKRTGAIVAVLAAVAVAAPRSAPAGEEGSAGHVARAELREAGGAVVGEATFQEAERGVLITLELRDVPPGVHALHIHETGRCTAPDFESAGEHFAPEGHEHGFFSKEGGHAGDLPNVHVGSDGQLTIESALEGVFLTHEGRQALLDGDGSAIVLHAEADDYRSQPGGDAGGRIACGVIEG